MPRLPAGRAFTGADGILQTHGRHGSLPGRNIMAGYYAVREGRTKGIFRTWDECKASVHKHKGAIYKKFETLEEAEQFMAGGLQEAPVRQVQPDGSVAEVSSDDGAVHAWVDGSFNTETNIYGYGVYIDDERMPRAYFGGAEMVDGGRNVEGEVAASILAIKNIMAELPGTPIVIHHDYQGIGSWANREWKANKEYTSSYADFVTECRENGAVIKFVHVDAHTGVAGNEAADQLAKAGCGMSDSRSFFKDLSETHSIYWEGDGFEEEYIFSDDDDAR